MTKYSLDFSRLTYYTIEVEAATAEDAMILAEDIIGTCDLDYEQGRDSLIVDSCMELED